MLLQNTKRLHCIKDGVSQRTNENENYRKIVKLTHKACYSDGDVNIVIIFDADSTCSRALLVTGSAVRVEWRHC